MEIISKTIQLLNPNQTPVDTCDQPVYVLTKLIQWAFPDIFGNTKYFSIFGGLHIGKSLLIIHREFIRGSGLAELMQQCKLSVSGLGNATQFASDIKQGRYGYRLLFAQFTISLRKHITTVVTS